MKLSDAARVLRSKNAGPLALTIDILFQDRDGYDLAADSSALDSQRRSRTSMDCRKIKWN